MVAGRRTLTFLLKMRVDVSVTAVGKMESDGSLSTVNAVSRENATDQSMV